MRKNQTKTAAFLLTVFLTGAAAVGCAAPETETAAQTEESSTEIPETESAEAESEAGFGEVGNTTAGFTLDSVSESAILQGEIYHFSHEASGAKLAWIANSDPELAFCIGYHTPCVDETDTNHIFEHAIITSSEKYPGTTLFFDLMGKSYNTFVNAFTYPVFTMYPLASESEDQLLKMMDVYMSCMAAPGILTEENLFKREALRYELDSPDGELVMTGTVFAEDNAYLTDVNSEANNNVVDALFPGQYAANSIGRMHRNYKDLTYEGAIATYERAYHFDNSLILLYGDMDCERVLQFLDSEYLSKAGVNGTDLSAYEDPKTEDGHVEVTVPVPAYEGDASENASRIDYAISMEEAAWEDLFVWQVIASALNQENGAFYENLKAQGIPNPAGAAIETTTGKPYLFFVLTYAEPEQAEAFRTAVLDTLSQVAEEGIQEELLHSVLKRIKTSSYLTRNQSNVGVNAFPDIINQWAHTGRTDYYETFEKMLSELEQDTEQETIRRLAAEARDAKRTALVSSVPEPGLAEELDAERAQWLSDKKASMSEEEISQLIQDTESFREWNEQTVSNNDFVVDPDEIEDVEANISYTKSEEDGVTYFLAPAEAEEVGSYVLYLDAGELTEEQMFELGLVDLLYGEIGTEEHSTEEILELGGEYFYSLSTTQIYPEGEDARPLYRISWTALTEDYEASLKYLLETLGQADYNDTARIRELLERNADQYDLSRTSDPMSLARDLAGAGINRDYAYRMTYLGQEFYQYLKECEQKLDEDASYGVELAGKLSETSGKLLKKGRIIFACAAPEESLEMIRNVTAAQLGALPEQEAGDVKIQIPAYGMRQAAAIEGASQYSAQVAYAYETDGFQGRYVPFLMAASDQYIVPKLRYQMGAYSAGLSFSANSGGVMAYSYSDPNASETLAVFDGLAEAIAGLELTEEELDGYILSALSSYGKVSGVLAEPLAAIENEIMGRDNSRLAETVNDMKHASLSDQQAAAAFFAELLENASIATVGNEAVLKAEAEAYDSVISYKEVE